MMKNIIRSPYRKMKILLILPVFAIVLYAFAKPEYRFPDPGESSVKNNGPLPPVTKEVTGKVVSEDGNPLPGASIVIRGTTTGTITDLNGSFKLEGLSDDNMLVVSFVGYQSVVIKPEFDSGMTIRMTRKLEVTDEITIYPPPPPPPPPSSKSHYIPDAPPPPPPPPPASLKNDGTGPDPLIVIDGIVVDVKVNDIDQETIQSITVLKDKSATDKYGEKGKNGVIEVTTKAKAAESGKGESVLKFRSADGSTAKPLVLVDGKETDPKTLDPNGIESISVLKDKSATELYGEKGKDGVILVKMKANYSSSEKNFADVKVTGYAQDQKANDGSFVVIEEMPVFPGGEKAMFAWISENMKYPMEAFNKKIAGKVSVNFVVSSSGKIKNVQIGTSVNPLLDAEALRVIKSMPDWKPGKQGGKPVNVDYSVPIEFKLK